jgi:hypothetical protein
MGVDKCNITQGAMDLLYVKEVAWMMRVTEVIKEATNTFLEFEAFCLRKTDCLLGDVP